MELFQCSWSCVLRPTGEARCPGDVQVEVLGGVDEHVQIPVRLRRQKTSSSSSSIIIIIIIIIIISDIAIVFFQLLRSSVREEQRVGGRSGHQAALLYSKSWADSSARLQLRSTSQLYKHLLFCRLGQICKANGSWISKTNIYRGIVEENAAFEYRKYSCRLILALIWFKLKAH